MKYYLIAGEASGDLHGSNLMKALGEQDESAEFRCWGGDLMEAQGGTLVKHYRDLAFMGFVEVLMNLRTILKNIKHCKQDILEYKPDVVILIDYPGFNLRIAEFLHEQGIKVFYYISPQVWAWKQSRVHKIKRVVDRMYVILPFEKAFYERFDYEVEFVGHPLLDAISDYQQNKPSFETFTTENQLENKPIIAVLPGSRKQEIAVKLPIMLSVVSAFPDHQFVIGGAPSISHEFYQNIIGQQPVKMVQGKTYELLQQATAAMVTSGTATLETALFQVPEVVCYKGGKISYLIARKLVKVDYISLVNLIMEREVVKELIQDELHTKNLIFELNKLVNDPKHLERLKSDYLQLKEKLGGKGASTTTATSMLKTLREVL